MKILIATESYYPNIDGGAVAQHNIALELAKRGHEIWIIAPSDSFKKTVEKEKGTTIYRTRAVKLPFYMAGRYHFSPFPIFTVSKILKKFKPDIVNSCSPYPVGVSAHICARNQDIPIIGSIHLLPDNIITPFLRLKHPEKIENFFWRYIINYFNRVDWAIIPTQTGADIYKKHGLKTNITPISNGLKTEIFKPENDGEYLRKRYKLPKKNIVLCAGRINEEKNLDVLIKAIPHVVKDIDSHFLFVGEGGEYKQRLINLADELGVGKYTTFTNFLSWKDYPNIFAVADLFAMPSEAELQSIVTMEAVATGLPVVVVNKGALPELASNNNGLLFEPKNHEQMAENMARILSDEKLKRNMSKNSLELIKNHSMESVAEQYEKTYEKAIEYYKNKK
jgi:glycosyltransferase involved in cell wall biosynthesis